MLMPSKTKLEKIAKLIRVWILESTSQAGSGHPTSSLSAVELMVGLFFSGIFRADFRNPKDANNDRLVLSKGHAAPLLYAIYAAAGVIPEKLLMSLRRFGSDLEGHPMVGFPYTEVPTGSLGQGLSAGIGIALAAQMNNLSYRTYVLLGDSEMAEGQVWEAIQFAGFRKLSNLVGIIDCNRLGQSGATMLGWKAGEYAKHINPFGWGTIVVDGHNLAAIITAYNKAIHSSKPVMIIAKTVKGKGVSFLENRNGWHGKVLDAKQLRVALQELGRIDRDVRGSITPPRSIRKKSVLSKTRIVNAHYDRHTAVSPRRAFGNALVRLAPKYPYLVVLDAEVKNSTYTGEFGNKHKDQFVESYIAEQNMVGIAQGLASRGFLPIAATFAAFLTRGYDQLRMAQYAGTRQIYAGTHAGVSIGPDGSSQMGLEDIALFRTLHNSTVLYPADAYATDRLLEQGIRAQGIVYLRLTRADMPLLYKQSETFPIGGSKTLRSSTKDVVTIVSAGITLFETLKAADALGKVGKAIRVIDCYSVKPIDTATLKKAARQTKALIVVEDHRPEGGLADAVRTALGKDAGKVVSLASAKIPHSGTSEQLLAFMGIDADAIIRAVRKVRKV